MENQEQGTAPGKKSLYLSNIYKMVPGPYCKIGSFQLISLKSDNNVVLIFTLMVV